MNSSEERLVAILDGMVECFYAVDRDWIITVFNTRAEEFFGRRRGEMVGRPLWDALAVREAPDIERRYLAAMAGRASDVFTSRSVARPGRWLEIRAFPLPDGMGAAFQDVTDRRSDVAALRGREAELARVQRIAGVGGLEVEFARGFMNRRSPEYLAIHGLPPSGAGESHEEWVARLHPADRERTERQFKDAVRGSATTYSAEYRIVRPSDGVTRWISATAEIERDADGRAVRLVGAHRDVTERKRAETHQRLLINELNHRVKNTLATVQSIAAQSLRGAATGAEAWASFESRLMALARAHDVLTRESWEGAELGDVVERAIEPYRESGADRFHVRGQSVRLEPRPALALAMALQELATNAVKYGALSNSVGRVEIEWTIVEERRLRLLWCERDGPPVTQPTRRGFGTRLIERGLAQELDGSVTLTFAPDGLCCELEATLSSA